MGTLRDVPLPDWRYLSVGDLADRWGVSRVSVFKRLGKHGLLSDDRKVKGGYVFTRQEIEGLEAEAGYPVRRPNPKVPPPDDVP